MSMEPAVSQEGRPRWTNLASLGYLMAAATPLMFLIAGFSFGLDIGSEGIFFAIAIVVPLVATFLIRKFEGAWSRIVGVILALGIFMMLFWTAFGVAYPNSFFDFFAGVLVVPGVLLAIVGNVASVVARRRGHFSVAPEGGERTAIRVVLASLAVLALLSSVLHVATRSTADESAAGATVVAKDFAFVEKRYEVAGGSTILFKNNDPFFHTFTVKELNIDVGITPGSSELIEIPAQAGTYIAYCKPHTDNDSPDPSGDDMATELVVA